VATSARSRAILHLQSGVRGSGCCLGTDLAGPRRGAASSGSCSSPVAAMSRSRRCSERDTEAEADLNLNLLLNLTRGGWGGRTFSALLLSSWKAAVPLLWTFSAPLCSALILEADPWTMACSFKEHARKQRRRKNTSYMFVHGPGHSWSRPPARGNARSIVFPSEIERYHHIVHM
jgi:hypothetical protein